MHVKCPVILFCPPGDGIKVDWLMRGQVRQMVCLQGSLRCLVVVLVGQEESRYGLTDPSSFWAVCKTSTVVVKK